MISVNVEAEVCFRSVLVKLEIPAAINLGE